MSTYGVRLLGSWSGAKRHGHAYMLQHQHQWRPQWFRTMGPDCGLGIKRQKGTHGFQLLYPIHLYSLFFYSVINISVYKRTSCFFHTLLYFPTQRFIYYISRKRKRQEENETKKKWNWRVKRGWKSVRAFCTCVEFFVLFFFKARSTPRLDSLWLVLLVRLWPCHVSL